MPDIQAGDIVDVDADCWSVRAVPVLAVRGDDIVVLTLLGAETAKRNEVRPAAEPARKA